MLKLYSYRFPNGNGAMLATVSPNTRGSTVIRRLAIPAPRSVLVLNGGTSKITPALEERLMPLFIELARLTKRHKITVVTGATNAGIFNLFGQAIESVGGYRAPIIGVAPDVSQEILEPHHSHFVLVEKTKWGGETPVMYRLIKSLTRHCPSAALFVGGGLITIVEMLYNVDQKRQMILISGSERSTDEVISTHKGTPTTKEDILRIARHGKIVPFDIDRSVKEFKGLIQKLLLEERGVAIKK